MKALISRRSIIIASAALLLAIIAIVSVNLLNSAGPVTGFANIVTRPVRAVASTVARTFGTIFAAIYEYDALEQRNEELLILLARYEQDFNESAALAKENAQLRELLEFRERQPGYDHEMATLRSWNADNWSSSFEINKGHMNSGIARGMGVATEYGVLIGQVSEVGATTSTVITILDTKFSAAAIVGRSDASAEEDSPGTVKGNFSYMRSGLLTLDNINDDLIVRRGDLVITSGQGGVFPAGLIVGEIDDIFRHTSGIGRFATVKPTYDIDSVSTVFIILEFENPE